MELGGAPPRSREPTAAPSRRRLPGAGGDGFCSATYTRAALLELRGAAVEPLPDPVVWLLRRLGLRRYRRRGVRAGRKSHRPIAVVVTARRERRLQQAGSGDGCDTRRCLSQPPRLTLRQTSQACRTIAPAPVSLMRVGHLNVRSLTRHLDDVNHLLLSENLDVLCLSESWLTESVDDRMLVFPGYAIIRRDRSGRSGGGVAIIYRNSMTMVPLKVPSGDSQLESLWAQLTGRRSVIVGAIYRPPSGPTAPIIADMHDQFVYVISKDMPVYILGDTNFDTNQTSKAGVGEYSRLLSDLSLHQLITSPTRPGPTASLIDHLITHRPDLTSDLRVVAANISDHDLIAASVAGVKRRQQPITITARSTRRLDQDALRLDLLLNDWDAVYRADTTEAKWDAWKTVWSPVIDRHMPLRQLKLRHQSQPWLFDENVRAARDARDQARLDRERTPCEATEQEYLYY